MLRSPAGRQLTGYLLMAHRRSSILYRRNSPEMGVRSLWVYLLMSKKGPSSSRWCWCRWIMLCLIRSRCLFGGLLLRCMLWLSSSAVIVCGCKRRWHIDGVHPECSESSYMAQGPTGGLGVFWFPRPVKIELYMVLGCYTLKDIRVHTLSSSKSQSIYTHTDTNFIYRH